MMFICEKNYSCCDYKYWDILDHVEQEAKECGHLIEVAPVRHGKWLPTTKWWQGGSSWKQCSECGILHLEKSNFCPNCGARMDG